MSRPRELAGSFQPTAPSVASSSPSEYSRVTNGEGPSSSRPSSSFDSRHVGRHGDDGRYSGSTQVETQPGDDLIEKRDFAQRRQNKVRRSGAFLLESALPSIRKRAGRRPEQKEPQANASSHQSMEPSSLRTPPRARLQAQREAGESAKKSRISTYGSPGQISASGSADARQASETTSARPSIDSDSSPQAPATMRTPAIDPAQIVNMALNLSESRRRHLSVGQLPAQPISTGRRIISGARANGVAMQGSYHDSNMGASLKQALQQQRRDSRNMSPGTGRSSPTSRKFTSPRAVSGYQPAPFPTQQPDAQFVFSNATLARAEKARKSLELKMEYLRLLQQLPPIAKAGESVTRAETLAGRQYNPLQAIRNRKVRTRERRPLIISSDEFDDHDRARAWVDAVEVAASARKDRGHTALSLPEYEGASGQTATKENGSISHTSSWPRLDWITTPSELLADTYWTEQNDNKLFMVDQHGNKVVRAGRMSTTARPRLSEDLARELDRLSGQFEDRSDIPQGESFKAEDSDVPSERGRLSRLGTGGHIGLRRPRRRSRQSSNLSSSDEDAALRERLQPDRAGSDDLNVGPLNRHLNKMLVEEANNANASQSPESPDLWDTGYASVKGDRPRPSLESKRTRPYDLNLARPAGKRPPLQRSPTSVGASQRGHPRDLPQSSLDDLSSTPNSPTRLNFERSLSGLHRERSPTSSPRGPLSRTHGRSKLGLFQPETRLREHTGSESFTDPDETMASRQTSGEQDAHQNEGSSKFVPQISKKLFSHRRGDSLNKVHGRNHSRTVNDYGDARDNNEPPSAVTRFFKGVGHSGTKMGDIILRKDRGDGDSDSVSSASDDDQRPLASDGRTYSKKRPMPVRRATTADTLGSNRSHRGKHFNLPTFRPANAVQESLETPYTTGDEDDRPERERGRQPPRLQTRFSGPTMATHENLSRAISGEALDDSSRTPSQTRQRLERTLKQPGLITDLPVTALTRFPPSSDKLERSASRPTLSDKRHWSITDQRRRSSQAARDAVVKPADIARARALLLCSGIKARTIYQNAHAVRSEPAPFLLTAFETAHGGQAAGKAESIRVPRKEEHVLAARLLSKELENNFAQLRASTQHFRDSVTADLHKQLADLRDLLADDLTPRIKASSDEADLYAKKLSQNLPLEAKNIYERAGTIIRNRRRRGRWLRRGGWAALEYLVLGIMWWAWFVVLIFRCARALVVGIFTAVRWLFWL